MTTVRGSRPRPTRPEARCPTRVRAVRRHAVRAWRLRERTLRRRGLLDHEVSQNHPQYFTVGKDLLRFSGELVAQVLLARRGAQKFR